LSSCEIFFLSNLLPIITPEWKSNEIVSLYQMAFTIVFIQELVQGKGVVVGLQEGDPINQAVLGAFVVTTLGLTAWLAIKGKDDYTKEEV
jgi:positive regulator of sigma E activity